MMKIKSLFRRGQGQGGGGSKGALRGASSVSSLDSKNPPPQTQLKTGSRDRVDRIGLIPPAKSERMKVSKNNNNKNEAKNILNGDTRSNDLTGPVSLPSTLEVCTDPSEELVSVQQQLELIAEEKLSLVLRLDAQQEELQQLKSEMARLQEQHTLEVDHLHEENASLRARLKDVAHSPLSDTEKQLLLDSHRLHTSSSAPASFAHNEQSDHINGPNEMSMSGANGIDGIPSSCPTPDWDKHSSSSMSEVSVACLQDRILQMEETHYSTNEELQATLQELADLQSQLLELQADNECLAREKDLLLESLCQQTEKLKDSRSTIDTLQELLIREQPETSAHREQKLVDLLKTAQEEKDTLLIKNEELNAEVHVLRQTTNTAHAEREQLADRVKLLESTLDSVHAEQKLLDEQLAQAKQQSSARRIEINRLGTLLDNARSKIDELEKERASQGDRSEVDALLDTARQEKDKLESQVATLQGQVSKGHCEKERLEERLSTLQEECKVTKNNAKSVISDLEYQLSEATREAGVLRSELQTVRSALTEVQTQAQHHLEDKRALKALLAETQRNLTDEQRLRKEENEEWDQFKRDLLTTVRVANDFKTEAQTELEKFVLENKSLRERVRALETELDKLKEATNPPSTISDSIPIPLLRQSSAPVLNSVQEMAARRQQRQENTLSVKSLIESIENATKQVKGGPGDSRSSSNSSLNSIVSNAVRSPTSPMPDTKSPLREQQQHTVSRTQRSPSSKNIITDFGYNGKGGVVDGKSEDTIRESVAILSGKNIDFVRRNSYGDLSERKDPLNSLVKNGGSKRNALLKWCQQKTVGYRNIDITNFSSSWNDGLALCALLHTYLPERVPYDTLVPSDKRRNFSLVFAAAESVGIQTTLNINDMCQLERPDWQQVMAYVTAIYKHFET